ncbi:CpsB/CapC family capsule biosynthesis tyrosine phosphatase [Gracilibacillus kekensis]|uniref:Tyrosine-protein phosphatase n=1 Tax=Gracilibacillus kekensis TaxID=1027249 RepID=A0A1M7K3L3_9BACI|nr:CpsB/CapC family capsule biosynthesis tyrosine phosphatase [Gracilibacillus kekensis]SHM59805.1 protein-tyrosine phosphatase [Gracilibacillus kekensis]
MLDINTYILPINRESVSDIASSIMMAKEAEKTGITNIIAAPRYIQGKLESNKDTIINLVNKLNEKLYAENVNVELIATQTIRITGDLEQALEKQTLLFHGKDPKYVLIELMYDHIPAYMKQLCYDIQLKGYKPILIHPEKNTVIQDDPNHLYSLVKNGALVQVSAKSLLGKKGKKLQKNTMQLLNHNLVHFVGSDTAETKHYYMEEAWQTLKRNVSIDQLYTMQDNMNLLVNGQMIQGEEPFPIKKKKILGIFNG